MPAMRPDVMPPTGITVLLDEIELFVLVEYAVRHVLDQDPAESGYVIELFYRHGSKLDSHHLALLVDQIEAVAEEPYTKRYRRDLENRVRAQWRELIRWLRAEGYAPPEGAHARRLRRQAAQADEPTPNI